MRVCGRISKPPRRCNKPHGMSLWRHKDHLLDGKIPQILLYGDSHLANLRKWATQSEDRDGPRPLDKIMLKSFKHCSVGGSTFNNVYQRTRNIKVPPTQPDRGDQWSEVLNDKTCNPTYIYVSLGGNDCDTFGQKLAWLSQQQLLACTYPTVYGTDMIRFDPLEFYQEELDKIIDQLESVITRLEVAFPDAEIIFSSVFEREPWDDLTLYLARTINWYMKFFRKHRMVNLNGMIPPEQLKDDKVHFLNLGYQTFMDKGIGMVLEFYYGHHSTKKRAGNAYVQP